MNKLALFPPPIVVAVLLGLAFGLNRAFPHLEILPATSVGWVWLISGLAFSASAAREFLRLKTTTLPTGTPTRLVILGPYLWTRNPMYLGLFTALLGLAFYMGTLPFWLVPPAFIAIMNRLHIAHEEARLTEIFGDEYTRYQQRVGRWL